MDEAFRHYDPPRDAAGLRAYRHWRESCFFVAHPPSDDGDVLAVTVISRPARRSMEAYLMTRVAGRLGFRRFAEPGSGNPARIAAGPVSVEVCRPYQEIRLRADDLDLLWTARTAPFDLDRGTLVDGAETIWDQRHMFQSGWFDGEYRVDGRRRTVDRWWGQRDHSWGIRDHRRAPMWLWLAIQLPDGMLGVWCWERADGGRVFTDGCWAPADRSAPTRLVAFRHDLAWIDTTDLAGRVEFDLADGTTVGVTGAGRASARYGPLGGGQNLMLVRTDDGRTGTAIYEVTGAHHHRYFPAGA